MEERITVMAKSVVWVLTLLVALATSVGELGAEEITIPLVFGEWEKIRDGDWEETAEGIRLFGLPYRRSDMIYSKSTFDLSGGGWMRTKFRMGNGSTYQAGGAIPIYGTPSPNYAAPQSEIHFHGRFFTTHHSFMGSYVMTPDVWYYVQTNMDASGSVEVVASTGDYGDRGGNVVFVDNVDFTGHAEYLQSVGVMAAYNDNYGTGNAYFELGEVVVSAAPPTLQTQKIISGVPLYRQGDQPTCGPTSAGMVMGYWDQAYQNLVTGDAQSQTAEVDTMIDRIGQLAGTGPGGTWQPLLVSAMFRYAWDRGVFSVAGGAIGAEAVALTRNINANCPAVMFTYARGDHYVVVDGYAGLVDPVSGDLSLTDLHLVDPHGIVFWDQGDDTPSWDALPWSQRDEWRYPVRGKILYFNPNPWGVGAGINSVLGGTFDSQEELEMFAIEGAEGQNSVEIAALPGDIERSVLAMTTDGAPISIAQCSLLAAGSGLSLSFDYLLPEDSKLEVFLDGNLVLVLEEPTLSMTSCEEFIDTAALGLDSSVEHELSLRFSAVGDPTLYVDDLAAVVEPIPEPATLSLLALGGLAMLKRRRRNAAATHGRPA